VTGFGILTGKGMQEDIRQEMIRLLPRLRAFARSLARSPDLADDLVQQTCEKALRNLSSFQPGTRLDVWLFRILRNGWIDLCRARRDTVTLDDLAEDGAELAGEDGRRTVEARLQLSAVERAMATLPAEQQEVLSLVCVAGLGYREAADLLGIPQGTVMSRLSRARIALHKMLEPDAGATAAPAVHAGKPTHARPE
jgi:RNA polymerase sigma-70 factor (ECF subfamily)